MKSVYIHIPFCNKICNYCDFCKFFYNKDWVNKYLIALENEIKNTYKNEKINTIYIGGGTPSTLSISELEKLFQIIKLFNIKELKEFTIECNVEDICDSKLNLFKKNNVNRISIGIQTFNKKKLKELGRNVNVNFDEKIKLAKKYFDNINLDLIYAVDNDISSLQNDIDKIISNDIPHISCYSLMIEPHTKFYDREKINEEIDYKMYSLINKLLVEKGYTHYEISNYSKPNYESKHNLVYWSNEEYYGFGVSASSFIDNKRYTNTKNIFNYFNGINNQEIEIINNELEIKYELILGFRKLKGINKNDFYKKYKKDIYLISNIKKLVEDNYLIDDGINIFINEKYLYVSNEILLNFI